MDPDLRPPFIVYKGYKPFLFISYAHADKKIVYPIIKNLFQKGTRIWYDEGIPPSYNYSDKLARMIRKCTCFLVFLTPRALKSDHVVNEINYALKYKKTMFIVYLENKDLKEKPGLEMELFKVQTLPKYDMTKEEFSRKLT